MLKGARYARSLCNSKLKQSPPFIVRCSAHLLNLLCHDVITVLGAKVIIKQAGNLSCFFRRAGEENYVLPRKMATMTDVRWNSAYELLDSVAANRHYIEEYSRRKKLAPLISDFILSTEFWYGVRKLLEVIRPVCIALNIMQSDSIKFGENIGVIVGISLAIGHCSITAVDKFRVISKCETRLDLLMREDPNLGKIGHCLHATGYFCHPGYRGMILSYVLKCQKIAEDGLKMLLARRQREGMKVSTGDVTQCIQLMLDFVSLQADAWSMRFGSNDLIDTIL